MAGPLDLCSRNVIHSKNEKGFRSAFQKLWPDLILCVENQMFLSHRHLLVYYSEYFKHFLRKVYKNYPEKRQTIITIEIEGVNKHIFGIIMKWITTGNIKLENANVAEIFLASKKLGITRLCKMTYDYSKRYLLAHDCDFYSMCCNLAPINPETFYALLELGYMSPFSLGTHIENSVDDLLGSPSYESSDIGPVTLTRSKKFLIDLSVKPISNEEHRFTQDRIMKYNTLNMTPIPNTILNIFQNNVMPKPLFIKPYFTSTTDTLTATPKSESQKETKVCSTALTIVLSKFLQPQK